MRIKNWHVIAVLSCVLWAAYYPALFAPLCPVDDVRMVNDLLNRQDIGWADVWFPHSITYYRPLVSGSFLLDLLLWNLETPFLHFENILFHWINALLVFVLTRLAARRLGVDVILVPFIAALVFALHPINTEAVIWVAGRADLLACTFILLSLVCTFRSFEKNTFQWSMAAALAFFLGCLAKETTLFVWPGILLMGYLAGRPRSEDLQRQGLRLRETLTPGLLCMISIAGYFMLRQLVLHGRDLGMSHVGKVISGTTNVSGQTSEVTSAGVSLWVDKLEWLLTVTGFYARKIIQPFPLNFGIVELPRFYLWIGILLILLCLFFLLRLTWTRIFFLITVCLGSVALLVAFGGVSWTPIAERYMYAPSAMMSIGLVLTGTRLLQGKRIELQYFVKGVIVILLLAAFAGVYQRGLVWQDNFTLFEDTVAKSPAFAMAQNQLAMEFLKRGERGRATDLLRDLEIPEFQAASLNKVFVLIEAGEYKQAQDFLLERLETLASYRRTILENLVKVSVLLQDSTSDPEVLAGYQREQEMYLEMLWESTHEPFYLYQLGRLYMQRGKRPLAQQAFAQAYALFPDTSLYKQPAGKLAEALKE